MLVLLVAATNILYLMQAHLFTQPSRLVGLPALFVPAATNLVLL